MNKLSKKKPHFQIRPEKIIIAHKNPDFDAFSSALAASLLYKDHVIIHSGEPTNNLQEFIALYEEKFPFYRENEVDFSQVKEAVVCDTSVEERLGSRIRTEFESRPIKVRIYDHHPVEKSQIFPNHELAHLSLEEIGSATTIVTELLKEKHIKIDREESTLLAIGIYEDTGNFLFSSTTPRDMKAAAYLIECGANIDVVSAFVKADMTDEQLEIMKRLERDTEILSINQAEIAIGKCEIEGFVGGLNLITSKIWLSKGYDTFISIVRMGKKTYIVGRTISPDVNLGEMMGKLRGGGHKRAAAAKLIDYSLEEACDKVMNALKEFIKPAVRAEDIMSFPVKTMRANMDIKRAYKIMKLTGYGGIPIVEENKLAGIVVRRDVQKAMDHHLGTHPVKSIMSTNLIVSDAEESVELVKEKMIENGIGRIPVIRDGMMVGLITRTDVIREVYHHEKSAKINISEDLRDENVKRLMMRTLSLEMYRFFEELGEIAQQHDYRIYIVGGFVRDLLLERPNLDIDIVVEGNAVEFTKLIMSLKQVKAEIHQKFLTAKVYFLEEDIEIDFATARSEYYEYPGALPSVDQAHLKKDLYRRDFTINALAIALNKNSFGRLIDYFGSRKDIDTGTVKILYNTSFIDDATRILRGIRYEQRYGFQLEERTLEHLEKALRDKYLEKISGGRIRYEIIRMLEEKKAVDMLKRLGELNVLKHLFEQTYYTTLLERKIERIAAALRWFEVYYEGTYKLNRFYGLLYVLIEYYTQSQLEFVKERYGIPKKTISEIYTFSKKVEVIARLLEEEMPFSEIYTILDGASPEAICYLTAYLNETGLNHLKEYLREKKRVKLYHVNGKRLIRDFGVKQGEAIKRIIREVFGMKLDGKLKTAEDEEAYLKEMFSERK